MAEQPTYSAYLTTPSKDRYSSVIDVLRNGQPRTFLPMARP